MGKRIKSLSVGRKKAKTVSCAGAMQLCLQKRSYQISQTAECSLETVAVSHTTTNLIVKSDTTSSITGKESHIRA